MTTPTTLSTTDPVLAAAEAHRTEHGHTVAMIPGVGWVCEICDDDADEVIAEYAETGRTTFLRPGAPAPAPAPLVEYVVLVDLGDDVVQVPVEATDPAAARSIAAEQARNNGYADAEAVDVEIASEVDEPVLPRYRVRVEDDDDAREIEVDAPDADAARRRAEDFASDDGMVSPVAVSTFEIS